MGKSLDLTGQRFGRLVALKKSERTDAKRNTWWICQCDCGNIKEVRTSCLIHGYAKSCGCYNREKAREHGRQMMTKHGWYGTRVYNIWCSIVDRCSNPKCPQYHNYGGRGIKMCDEWRHHPELFCEWAMDNGYADNLTIDRIDANGNYEPSNCRWITNAEQQTNKRNNVLITYDGKTHCVAEWARALGVNQFNIYNRIYAGWTNPKEILFGR